MKKVLVLLLILLFYATCIHAFAEEPKRETYDSGDYSYALLDDGTAEITKYCGEAETLEVPAELDGYVVTAIGDLAFSSCSCLTSVTLPDSVTTIGANPFRSCKNLKKIIVSPDHPTLATIDGALFSKSDKKLIYYPCASTQNTYAVPQGIEVIGDYAFFGCFSLTSITLPDSVTTIGDQAFLGCSSLSSITLPDSVTAIGDGAFYGCSELTITVGRDSYAKKYCIDHDLPYTYPDANDWLNE